MKVSALSASPQFPGHNKWTTLSYTQKSKITVFVDDKEIRNVVSFDITEGVVRHHVALIDGTVLGSGDQAFMAEIRGVVRVEGYPDAEPA